MAPSPGCLCLCEGTAGYEYGAMKNFAAGTVSRHENETARQGQ